MQTINGIRNSLAALWQKPLWQKTVNITYVACRTLQEFASKNWASAVSTGRLYAHRVSKNPMPVVVIVAGCILIPSVVALVVKCCRRKKVTQPDPKPTPENKSTEAPATPAISSDSGSGQAQAKPKPDAEKKSTDAPATPAISSESGSGQAQVERKATQERLPTLALPPTSEGEGRGQLSEVQPQSVRFLMVDQGRHAVISIAPKTPRLEAIPGQPSSVSEVAAPVAAPVLAFEILLGMNSQPQPVISEPQQPGASSAPQAETQAVAAASAMPSVQQLPSITPLEVQTASVSQVGTAVLVAPTPKEASSVSPEPVVDTMSNQATAEQVSNVALVNLGAPIAQESKQAAAEPQDDSLIAPGNPPALQNVSIIAIPQQPMVFAQTPRATSPLKPAHIVAGHLAALDRFRAPRHPPSSPRCRPLLPEHEAEVKQVADAKRELKRLGKNKTAKPAIPKINVITLRSGAIEEFDTLVEGLSKAKSKEKEACEKEAVTRFIKLIQQGHVPTANSKTATAVRELLDKYAKGDALQEGAANYFRMNTQEQAAGVPLDKLKNNHCEACLWMQIAVMKYNVKKDLGRFGYLLLDTGHGKLFLELYPKILEEADKGDDEGGYAACAIGCDFFKKNELTKAKEYFLKAQEKGNLKAKEILEALLKKECQERQQQYNNYLKRFRDAPGGDEGLAQKEGTARDLAKFFINTRLFPINFDRRECLKILKQGEFLAASNARPKQLTALCHQAQLNVGSRFYERARRGKGEERQQLLAEAVLWFEQPILRMIEEEEMVKVTAECGEIEVSRDSAVDQFAKAVLLTAAITEDQRKVLWTLVEKNKEKNRTALLAVAKGLLCCSKVEATQFQSRPAEETQQRLKEENELLAQALAHFREAGNGVVEQEHPVNCVIKTFVSQIEKEQKLGSEYEALISKTTTVDDLERLALCLQTYCPRAWDYRGVVALGNGVGLAWGLERFNSAKKFVKVLEDIGRKFYDLAAKENTLEMQQAYFGVAANWYRYPQVVHNEQPSRGIPDRDAVTWFAMSVIQWANMSLKDRMKLIGKFNIERTNHRVWKNLFDNAEGLWYLQSHEKDLAKANKYFAAAAAVGSKFAQKQLAELASELRNDG